MPVTLHSFDVGATQYPAKRAGNLVCDAGQALTADADPAYHCTAISEVQFIHPETCETRWLRTECRSDGTVANIIIGPDGQPMENPDMNDFVPVVPSTEGNTIQTQQIIDFDIALAATDAAFAGTIADVLNDALAANPIVWPDGAAVTAADLSDWSVKTLACEVQYLTDPTDATTAVTVTTDSSFYNGVQIRSAGDEQKGGTDVSGPYLQAVGEDAGVSVSRFCFMFAREVNKNGDPV